MTTGDELTRPFPPFGATFLHQLASHRLSEQLNQIDGLDQKIATLFGIGQALIGVAAAFLALAPQAPPMSAFVILAVAGAFWLDLSWYSFAGYSLRDWQCGPDLRDAWKYARQYDDPLLNWWAAESFTNCYFNNRKYVNYKVFCARFAMVFLTAQTLAILIALGITAAT